MATVVTDAGTPAARPAATLFDVFCVQSLDFAMERRAVTTRLPQWKRGAKEANATWRESRRRGQSPRRRVGCCSGWNAPRDGGRPYDAGGGYDTWWSPMERLGQEERARRTCVAPLDRLREPPGALPRAGRSGKRLLARRQRRCGNKEGASKCPVATLTIQKKRTQRVDLPRGPRRRKGAQGLGLERDAKI